jgi:hypothetical protein
VAALTGGFRRKADFAPVPRISKSGGCLLALPAAAEAAVEEDRGAGEGVGLLPLTPGEGSSEGRAFAGEALLNVPAALYLSGSRSNASAQPFAQK